MFRFPAASLVVLAVLLTAATVAHADRVVLVAGGGTSGDGSPAVESQLHAPFGVDTDRAGDLYIIEMLGNRLRKIDPAGLLSTLAGNGAKGEAGDGGPAAKALLNGPHSLAVSPDGDLYVADTWNARLRKIDARSGVITTVAGGGIKGYGGDAGPSGEARFGDLYCVAFDPKGERLYLADLDNRRIRVIDRKSGIVSTIAGNGRRGVPTDGADARTAPLLDPRAVAADAAGNVYILERSGNALRVVDRTGRIRTVAGTGRKGFSGDGGSALRAELNGPKHLCIDRDGSVLIADTENHVIRRYSPDTGKIERVAGTGTKGTGGVGGPPEQVQLNQPHGVFVHPSGALYIADSSNNRVLKIER
jgi:DNA-binding beta-propeller fold protein YncE